MKSFLSTRTKSLYADIPIAIIIMNTALLRSHEDVLEARARIFRALGDENRLRIFQVIVEAEGPLNVSEICDRVDLSPNLVSHHLQCLKNCTIVDVTKAGRKRFYEVARPEAVEMVTLADECIKQDIEHVLGCEIVEKTGDEGG